MTSTKEKRFKRLVEVRKHQRNEVTTAVERARATRDERDSELQRATEAVQFEARAGQVRPLEPLDPGQRRLQVDCLIAAYAEAAARETKLREAEVQLSGETKRLFAAHARVRQMELLADAEKQAEVVKTNKAEQKTADDLSLIKEADK